MVPFHTWSIDLVTKLLPPNEQGETTLIVAVDSFTKFVEASPIANKASLTTARWLYQSIVCRYGIPRLVRCDRGKEFEGNFKRLCHDLGIIVAPVCRAHPRANGQVERYNGAILQGFRRMASGKEGSVPWFLALPTVLAGLRMLPTYLGYSPFYLTYK